MAVAAHREGEAKGISRRLEMVVLDHIEREDRQPGEEQVWGLRPRRFTVGKLEEGSRLDGEGGCLF